MADIPKLCGSQLAFIGLRDVDVGEKKIIKDASDRSQASPERTGHDLLAFSIPVLVPC